MYSALSLSVDQLTKLQSGAYLRAASLILFIYDYLLTVSDEVDLVWSKPQGFRLAGILFFFNRYPPFIDLSLSLYSQFTRNLPTQRCIQLDNALGAMFMLGVIISEVIMILRVWILWGGMCTATLFLLALVAVAAVVLAVCYGLSWNAPQHVYSTIGCSVAGNMSFALLDFSMLLLIELTILILTIVECLKRAKLSFGALITPLTLIDLFARDGLIYFVCLVAVGIANIAVMLVDADMSIHRVISLQRCFHSILVSRIFIYLRQFLVSSTPRSLPCARETATDIRCSA